MTLLGTYECTIVFQFLFSIKTTHLIVLINGDKKGIIHNTESLEECLSDRSNKLMFFLTNLKVSILILFLNVSFA